MKNVKTSRRKFFGFLAAAPVASKQLAEVALKDMDVTTLGSHSLGLPATQEGPVGFEKKRHTLAQVQAMLRGQVPEWFIDNARENYRYGRSMDVSVAALRSVSLSGKHQIALRRHIENQKATFWDNFKTEKTAAQTFMEKTGWYI